MTNTSSPSAPESVSLPPNPVMVSEPLDPVSESLPDVPLTIICHLEAHSHFVTVPKAARLDDERPGALLPGDSDQVTESALGFLVNLSPPGVRPRPAPRLRSAPGRRPSRSSR